VLLDQARRLGLHAQLETGVALGLRGDEIEEVPLRHQRDKAALRREVGEIGDLQRPVAYDGGKLLNFLMWTLKKAGEQPELVHHLERRGMDGVAAKITQEIGVFLEHVDLHAGARQQQAQHHARGATADNTAAPVNARCVHVPCASALG
jgi:hypothetical protein